MLFIYCLFSGCALLKDGEVDKLFMISIPCIMDDTASKSVASDISTRRDNYERLVMSASISVSVTFVRCLLLISFGLLTEKEKITKYLKRYVNVFLGVIFGLCIGRSG